MLPAGSVMRYWPPVTCSLVPSLSDCSGQSLELLSKDSKKSSCVGDAEALGLADEPGCDPGADVGCAFGEESLPQAATSAPAASSAAAARARVERPTVTPVCPAPDTRRPGEHHKRDVQRRYRAVIVPAG